MGVFSFMETFFFISLGITFILILLLVYHFKQRISTLEQKHDTMFEIVNNIVKQLRNMQMNMQHLGEPVNFPIPVHQHCTVQPDHVPMIDMVNLPQYSESESEEDGSDSEEDSSDSTSEEDDSDSEEDDSDSEEDDSSKSEEDTRESEEDSRESVKEAEPVIEDPMTIPNDDLAISQVTTLDEPDDEIIIRKSDGSITMMNESSEPSKDMYKKMTITALKAAVKEKGLSQDPSKMKKQELVQLLESQNE
jgi:hypothetical protein